MRPSPACFAKGFLSRSFDELVRRSSIAWNLEAVKGPSGPRQLYDLSAAEPIRDCVVMCDTIIGGSSTSNLDFVNRTDEQLHPHEPRSYARFHGTISTALPPAQERPDVKRSGFAAFRTPKQRPTLFGRSFWDIDPYKFLAMRVKSDGRAYLINVQTETIEPSDIHQHRLFAKYPGQWETILVKWNDLVRTNHSFVVEPQMGFLRQRVRTIGVGLTDRKQGPFELCVQAIWATNDVDEDTTPIEGAVGQLRNRKGESIRW